MAPKGQNFKQQEMQVRGRLTLAWLRTLQEFLNLSKLPFFGGGGSYFLFPSIWSKCICEGKKGRKGVKGRRKKERKFKWPHGCG